MYEVQIETYKNPLGSDPFISTTFRGGSGQAYTQSMDALVLRSDNMIEFESIPYPQVGSQIIMNGTTGTDRLVVDIVMANERYRVVDELMPLKSYNWVKKQRSNEKKTIFLKTLIIPFTFLMKIQSTIMMT